MGYVSAMRHGVRATVQRPFFLGLAASVSLSVALVLWQPRMAPPEAHYVPPPPEAPIDFSGLPNFHWVTADLCRGAQPSYRGFGELKRLGVKTVVSLRWTRTDRRTVEGLGLAYEHLPIHDLHADLGHLLSVLRVLTDKGRCPVFVHCLNGADRTGFICAGYRVVVCGWGRDEALREMWDERFGTDVDFGKLPDRIREVKADEFRKDLGLAK